MPPISNVKMAALVAKNHLVVTQLGARLFHVRVEEAELSSDGKYWLITLSYYDEPSLKIPKYKIFKIDKNNGEVLAMKIRSFE